MDQYIGIEDISMKIRVAQLTVGNNLNTNVKAMLSIIDTSEADEWVIFPEGILSGYAPENPDYTAKLNPDKIIETIAEMASDVQSKAINCIFGTALKIGENWFNASIVLFADGRYEIYMKNNLSHLDRNHFTHGNALPVYTGSNVTFGIQMCREIVFPEQWKVLKRKGAKIIFHVNNAIQPHDARWRNVIITRAIENQIFVCSVNNCASPQALPSLLVSPKGEVLFESHLQSEQIQVAEIDLNVVEDYYLTQERTDIVNLSYSD